MEIQDRIRRRQRREGDGQLVLDYAALSPISHVAEPTDRGTILEQTLDLFDPVFDGELPPNAYVWGPRGSGKSAVLTALCRNLGRLPLQSGSIIHTTTRAQSSTPPEFVYLDVREAASDFGVYHGLLDGLVDERVPENGLGTTTLRDRLIARLADRPAIAVLDHVNERGTLSHETLDDLLSPCGDGIRWVTVGRDKPDHLDWEPPTVIGVNAYRPQTLIDVLTARADDGLGRRALDHQGARRIAEWAEGDAHDALTALFVAADIAAGRGNGRIEMRDVEVGIGEVPRPSVTLARVLTAPANRQAVLRELISLKRAERSSVSAATSAISEASTIDLSAGTVKRFLYELAEGGLLKRIENDRGGQGRPPSRLEPAFSPTVFARLYDQRREASSTPR